MKPDHEDILKYMVALLQELAQDWDYSRSIGPQTGLFSDLGFESLDAVVLGAAIQDHYRRQMPFAELLADVGQREVRDLTVAELVEFIHTHVSGAGIPGRDAGQAVPSPLS